jgi:hypothetical protein
VDGAVGIGLGVRIGDGVAGPALPVMTVGLGVGVAGLEQATTATRRNRIEPIRARRRVCTLSSSIIHIAVAS